MFVGLLRITPDGLTFSGNLFSTCWRAASPPLRGPLQYRHSWQCRCTATSGSPWRAVARRD